MTKQNNIIINQTAFIFKQAITENTGLCFKHLSGFENITSISYSYCPVSIPVFKDLSVIFKDSRFQSSVLICGDEAIRLFIFALLFVPFKLLF